jgi:DNA-binding transcriptional ArsR family regulator
MDHSQLVDYPAADVLVVREPTQLRALGGELRHHIVVLLRERAASATELAKTLGVPKGTVGYHLKVLEEAGLVRVVATRRVRAVTEKFYGRVARLFQLSPEVTFEEAHPKGAFVAKMLRHGADELPLNGVDPELIKGTLSHARLRPAAARRFIRRLDKLLVEFRAAEDPDGEIFAFAASIFPTSPQFPERDDDV